METIKLELTREEFKSLESILKKIEYVKYPPVQKPKKWQREGDYLINIKTGRKMDIRTKKFFD